MREHDASAYARASAKHDAPAHATDGRTDGLTQKNLRNDGIFSSATPAGGHGDSSIDGATKTLLEDLGIVQGARAKNIRRGERAPISKVTRRLIYKRDRWSCQICGARPFAATEDRMSGALHLDHIVPWSAGGSDRSDNLRTLCGPCNYKRSNFVTGREAPAVAVVRICAPCLCPDAAAKPSDAFDAYCASRHHPSWAIPGWQVL